MIDTYIPNDEREPFTQSLRCYSPADLRLLLEGTGLQLVDVWSGGSYDVRAGRWTPEVALGRAMSYTAILKASP